MKPVVMLLPVKQVTEWGENKGTRNEYTKHVVPGGATAYTSIPRIYYTWSRIVHYFICCVCLFVAGWGGGLYACCARVLYLSQRGKLRSAF